MSLLLFLCCCSYDSKGQSLIKELTRLVTATVGRVAEFVPGSAHPRFSDDEPSLDGTRQGPMSCSATRAIVEELMRTVRAVN